MRKVIAGLICIVTALLFAGGCKKDNTADIPDTNTIQKVVQKVIGYYNVTLICTSNNGNGTYTTDTASNVQWIISTANDSTIIMDNNTLYFTGDLNGSSYAFYAPASGGGYNAQFDSGGHTIIFGISNSGMAGGGCGGSGSK